MKTAAAQGPLTIPRATLLGAIEGVRRVVETRNSIPILSNMLIQATGGMLLLKATDLDIEASHRLECAGELAITVPARLLYDALRKCPEGGDVALAMDADKARLVLKAGRSRFTLQVLPVEDFPDMAGAVDPLRFDLPAAIVLRLFGTVQFAISTEETRYYLNGIYWHVAETDDGPRLTAVATNGHILARDRTEAPADSAGMPGIIIPRKTVGEIIAMAKSAIEADKSAPLSFEISPAKIRVQDTRGGALVSKLIDGTFPDYVRVIPTANDKRLVAERNEMAASAERVSVISSERGRAVKVSLSEGKCTLSVTNPDAGTATAEMEVDYDSAAIDIGFNSRYLADVLAHIDSDTVLVKLSDPGSPTLVQSREGADAQFVIMPMRV